MMRQWQGGARESSLRLELKALQRKTGRSAGPLEHH